jgi:hypothetical protein
LAGAGLPLTPSDPHLVTALSGGCYAAVADLRQAVDMTEEPELIDLNEEQPSRLQQAMDVLLWLFVLAGACAFVAYIA